MSDRTTITLHFEEVENGWIQARVAEYPEVVTAAKDRREAELHALDALRQYLASFEPGEPIPRATGRQSVEA